MKRTRIRPMSDRRRKVNATRRANVVSRYGQNPACHACLPLQLVGIDRARTGCNGWADDAHELVSRARSGTDDNLTDPDGIRPVSRACHTYITEHPDIAEDAGLALPPPQVRQPLRIVDPYTGLLR